MAAKLVVLELLAARRKARPSSTENGRVAGKGVGSPPRMKARRTRASPTPWGATSKGVGNLMRRGEHEHRQPHEVRRAGTGAAASDLVLEVLAAKWKVRSPPSEDGGAAHREHRGFADDRGALGKRGGGLKHGGARSVGRQVARIVVRQVGNKVTASQAKSPHLPHK